MSPDAAPPQSPPAGVRHRVPMHPGVFLERHYLKPLALTQSEAARRLGVSRRRVHELVHGQRAMSVDTALRCAQQFAMPAAEWLAMQSEWDAWCAWRVMRQQLNPRADAVDGADPH
ncbi:MAG: HigA family addiction module antitoxin [Rubrivivax sp.]|jgi:addiction module HigA family antidote|nr:HigA family addiction module antitoxin [Rubrivivax sp.]